MDSDKIAIVIGIEQYFHSPVGRSIPPVPFADNDAELICSVFEEDLSFDKIYRYQNQAATKMSLENDIPYIIQSLPAGSELFLYYVGHGCYAGGQNCLTACDSNTFNLADTTVPIEKLVLGPLSKSQCRKSIVFLDACSENIKEIGVGRGIIDSLDYSEFQKFVTLSQYMAVFCASSPGKKSYPSKQLGNGIWTHFLAKALRGQAVEALERERFLTSQSLQDYLSYQVPSFITQHTEIRDTQEPFAKFEANNSFAIVEFKKADRSMTPAGIAVDFNSAVLKNVDSQSVRSASWFEKKRGHFVPDRYNDSAVKFIQGKEFEAISSETNEVYIRAKKILSLKRRDMQLTLAEEGCSLDTELFRYRVDVDLDSDDPSQYLVIRSIVLRKDFGNYPADFDTIFTNKFDRIELSYDGDLDFDELVNRFEDLQDDHEFSLDEDQASKTIRLKLLSGLVADLNLEIRSIVFFPRAAAGCISLIQEFSMQYLADFGVVSLLESDGIRANIGFETDNRVMPDCRSRT